MAALCAIMSSDPSALANPPNTAARVEFECKIVTPLQERAYSAWNILVKRANGQIVHRSTKGAGDTLRLRDLRPGIYVVCLSGDKSRERCESVDLTPEKNQRIARFNMLFEAPLSQLRSSALRVSARRLAIPRLASEEFGRAERAQADGDTGEFLRRIRLALQYCPDYPDALNNLGVYYHRQGDNSRSIDHFRRALALDPDLYAAWINLGSSLLASGRLAEALEAQQRAMSLRPRDPLAHSQLALTHYYMRDYGKAREHFISVMEEDPASASLPQLYLAHIALAQQQHGEAQVYIRSFLEKHPNSPHAPRMRRTLETIGSEDAGAGLVGAGQDSPR